MAAYAGAVVSDVSLPLTALVVVVGIVGPQISKVLGVSDPLAWVLSLTPGVVVVGSGSGLFMSSLLSSLMSDT